MRVALASGAMLVLLGGPADGAASASASLPRTDVTVPSIGVNVPSIGVDVPSVTVNVPGVGVSTPSVSVSTPSVGASTPAVSATTPSASAAVPAVSVSSTGVTVSGPTVSVSPPSVGVSAPSAPPSAPESGTPKSPVTGSPTNPRSGSEEPPTSGSGPSSGAGERSTVTLTPGAATGGPLSPTAAARPNVADVPDGHLGSVPSRRSHGALRHGSSVGAGPRTSTSALGKGRISLDESASVGAISHRRAPAHSSSLLARIGAGIPLPIPVPNWSKPIIVALALLAIALGLRARRSSMRARRLEGQRTTLLRDLETMQAALVPEVPARLGGLALSVAYRPADGPAAGGDFYDVFTPQPGKVAIILGDVSGHGHEALTHAALTRYTLRAYMQAGMEPRAALALAGRVLVDPTIEHYATVIVAVYDTRDGRLTYASAGHPHPIMHGLSELEPLTMYSSPPVGWDVPTGRRQTTLSLSPGSIVCLFSDGLIEARCRGGLLGVERLSEILAGLDARPEAGQLLEGVRSVATATPDDMAACVFTPLATVSSARVHIEEVEVDARALSAPGLPRFLASCRVPAPEITQTLARAQAIAARFGTAMLRIDLGARGATVRASPCGQPPAMTDDRRSRPVEQPFPRALSTV
jgi:hypothetical protein